MSMRISDRLLLAGALALVGCSGGTGGQGTDQSGTAAAAAETPGLPIDCALAGAPHYSRDCTVEQTATADGTILTVRHADGGFRRLRATQDGHGVASADGAAPSQVSIAGDRQIEVRIADDRYRLPATVGPK